MARLLILLAIAGLCLVVGGASVFQEWWTIPAAPPESFPAWTSKQGPNRQAEIDQIKELVEKGRIAVINQDDKPLGSLSEGDSSNKLLEAIAKTFHESQVISEQVALYCSLLREENFDRLVDVYAKLHNQQKLCDILRPEVSGTPPAEGASGGQRFSDLRTRAVAVVDMTDKLHEPLDRFLIWRTIARVAKNFAKPDFDNPEFDARRYKDCVILCGEALSHPGSLNSDDQETLEGWLFHAREGIDWHFATSPNNAAVDIERIRVYVDKYRIKTPEQRPSPHMYDAELRYAKLEWEQLAKKVPSQIIQRINCPPQEDRIAAAAEEVEINIEGRDLENLIHTLHAFCGRHSVDREHWACARASAALLLREIIVKNPVLTPSPSNTVEIQVRRDSSKFEGDLIDLETNEQVVTMKNPRNDEEIRHFFQDALVAKPAYTAESRKERVYGRVFKRVIVELENFGWESPLMEEFLSACVERGLEQRVKLVESLAKLVSGCTEFRPPVAADQ